MKQKASYFERNIMVRFLLLKSESWEGNRRLGWILPLYSTDILPALATVILGKFSR